MPKTAQEILKEMETWKSEKSLFLILAPFRNCRFRLSKPWTVFFRVERFGVLANLGAGVLLHSCWGSTWVLCGWVKTG